MKNRPRLSPWSFVLAALIISIVSLSLFSAVQAASRSVPFKAQITAHELVVDNSPSCPAQHSSTILGTGVGTHVGRFTINMRDCFTLLPFPPFEFQNGAFTLTAADGSELHGTYEGDLLATDKFPILQLQGTYQIIGGTKRFQNATGSGALSGTDNIFTGEVAVSLDGTINF